MDDLNNNGGLLLDICAQNEMSVMGTWFQHKKIHQVTWLHPDGVHGGQIDHIITRQRDRRDIQDVRMYRGADISASHCLVVAEVKNEVQDASQEERTW